jgi:hypothetical protein
MTEEYMAFIKHFRECRNRVLVYRGNVSRVGYTVNNKRCFVRTRPATSMKEGADEKHCHISSAMLSEKYG